MAAVTEPGDSVIELETVSAYQDLRTGIGVLGLILPFALMIGHAGLQGSISSFYYTNMRNWFVGTMWAIGFFLIFYHYQKVDNILSNAAGVLAILVSMFPTTGPHPTTATRVVGGFHLGFAAGFLGLLAYFCLFLFTRSDLPAEARPKRKNIRNRIYISCGIAIIVGVVAAAVCEIPAFHSFRSSSNAVFWGESLAVWAFGFAWLVKGGVLLADTAKRPAAAVPDPV